MGLEIRDGLLTAEIHWDDIFKRSCQTLGVT